MLLGLYTLQSSLLYLVEPLNLTALKHKRTMAHAHHQDTKSTQLRRFSSKHSTRRQQAGRDPSNSGTDPAIRFWCYGLGA
jgi:hypothetical protein